MNGADFSLASFAVAVGCFITSTSARKLSCFLQGVDPLLFCSLLLIVGFVFIVVAVSTGTRNGFLQAADGREAGRKNGAGELPQTFHTRNTETLSLTAVSASKPSAARPGGR